MNRLVSYTVGLGLALALTITAFGIAFMRTGTLPGGIPAVLVVPVILALAFIQLFVQLYFFLHLGLQKEARWNSIMFGVTFVGITVVIGASIWIMYHLNYNMTPEQMSQYIESQSGL